MDYIVNYGHVKKLFAGSNFKYGYYAFVDSNDQFVIGEERGREGGEYKGENTPWLNDIKNENIKLYSRIVEYFKMYKNNLKNAISEYDSKNGIDHKCPCCGYEVEWDWDTGFIKGDESFIKIKNTYRDTICFDTDKPRHVDWGKPATEMVLLLGCPKCGTVSFQFD